MISTCGYSALEEMPRGRQVGEGGVSIKAEIGHQREMIGWILQRRHTMVTDLLSSGEGQPLVDVEMPLAEEDVVDGVAALAVTADLPRGVSRFRTVLLPVGRIQVEARVVHDGPVDRFTGLGVEVTAKDDGHVVADALLQEVQDVFALLVTEGR